MQRRRIQVVFGLAALIVLGMLSGRKETPAPPAPSEPPARVALVSPAIPSVQAPAQAAPPVLRPPSAAPVRLRVTGTGVALRGEPSRDGAILDRLSRPLVVEALESAGEWVKVQHPLTAVEGWVFAKLLEAEGDAPRPEQKPRPVPQVQPPSVPALSAAMIAQRLVAESRAAYPGSCACPYDVDRGGRRCGARSAYSKPGGYAPICYESDVTAAMLKRYRGQP
ncbi:SH3 domain-containing protein [Xanthobacter sp. KR7-225]|uniref:SH3 domain-containing protein n=1 Tax=Xanthobacter sp. KR7-225 TaxID=3156613 RepID=UPI0032B34225